MALSAGFAEIDITPRLGTPKIGWLKRLTIERVRDPLYARAAVFESGGVTVGFAALDLLSVRRSTVAAIRERITRELGVPGAHVMIGATHSHGGPAMATAGEVIGDERYIAEVTEKIVRVFGEAHARLQPARIGFGQTTEFNVGFNRRVIMRNGTTRTHGRFADPDALCIEGPMDPEVAVIAAQSLAGEPLGVLVNFACHPTHFGGDDTCTAGWPGVFADEMKRAGWPVPLFLQGAAGDIHTSSPAAAADVPMEDAGRTVAADAQRVIAAMEFGERLAPLGGASRTVQLPHREPTEEQVRGTARGAQRFIDPAIYERGMPALLDRIRREPLQPAEVQAVFFGERVIVAIPAEYFACLGLRIKERANPLHALVVAYANGMVGYVPHRAAFDRGGYETTFAASSRLAPEAGDLLADAAVELIRAGPNS